METKRPFGAKFYSEVLQEGLRYIQDRRLGKIKSFKLPWDGLNKSGVGGIEWNSLVTIGARPASGKTMFTSQILKESRILNPTQDFNILEFQFEMGEKQQGARAFAAETALDYDRVLSTNKQLDEFAFEMMIKHTEDTKELENNGIQRLVISTPLGHKDIEKAIHTWYNALGGKPMIVTIDHSWLIKRAPDEKEKLTTLYNATETLMKVKNELPIIVFMITQLNRNIEDVGRRVPGNIANYPTSSDVFGGDALQQGSDMVIALSRPFTLNIGVYGPKEYVVSKEDIFVHILKSRNSADDRNILFLKGDFSKQRMYEVGEPSANNPTGASFTPRRSGGSGRRQATSADINV